MLSKPTYAMSRVGGCPKALGAMRLGHKPLSTPTYLEIAGREGTRHEQWIKEDMRAEGYKIEEGGPCEICAKRHNIPMSRVRSGIHVELDYDLFTLVGHLDGRLHALKGGVALSKHRPLEIKALSRFRAQKFFDKGIVEFGNFAAQETCYMEAEGEDHWPGHFVVKNRDTGYKKEIEILSPPMDMEELVDRVTLVEGNARVKRLLNWECPVWDRLNCPFNYLCGGNVVDVTRHVDDEEVKEAIRLYKEWEFSSLITTQAKEVIKAWMQERDIRGGFDIDGVVGNLTPMTRTTYSKSSLKEAGVDSFTLAKAAHYSSYDALTLAIKGPMSDTKKHFTGLEE